MYRRNFRLDFSPNFVSIPSASPPPQKKKKNRYNIYTAHGREPEEQDGHAAGVVQRGVHAEGRQRRDAALPHSEGGRHPHQELGRPDRPFSPGVEPRQGGHPHAQVSEFFFCRYHHLLFAFIYDHRHLLFVLSSSPFFSLSSSSFCFIILKYLSPTSTYVSRILGEMLYTTQDKHTPWTSFQSTTVTPQRVSMVLLPSDTLSGSCLMRSFPTPPSSGLATLLAAEYLSFENRVLSCVVYIRHVGWVKRR